MLPHNLVANEPFPPNEAANVNARTNTLTLTGKKNEQRRFTLLDAMTQDNSYTKIKSPNLFVT